MSSLKIWNGYMRCYDFLAQVDSYQQNLREVADAARIQRGDVVLDAGSGTGNLSVILRDKGADVTSCDFSPDALAIHKQKDPFSKVVEANLEEHLPFKDGQFDSVCCASVIFALSQKGCKNAVSEFMRVLRPGGVAIITVPAVEARLGKLVEMHVRGSTRRFGIVRGSFNAMLATPALIRVLWYNKRLKSLPDWQGFHYFNETELLALVTNAGFADVELKRTYGGCFFLISMRKAAATTVIRLPAYESKLSVIAVTGLSA